jgi:ferric-dicitrate binding protein FerR (iron transport regulator)
MRQALAITLLTLCAATHAQSYEERAAAERAQQTIDAYDKMKMDQARAAQEPKKAPSETAERDPLIEGAVLVGCIGLAGFLWFRKRSKPTS